MSEKMISTMQVWPHDGPVEVKHFRSPDKPWTTLGFGTGGNSVTLYIDNPDMAQDIIRAMQEVVRGYPSLKDKADE